MGAQVAKNGAKEEIVAEKANGQENGHAKTNGNSSPTAEGAAEDVQSNGKHSPDSEAKEEEATPEKNEGEPVAEVAPESNGENGSTPLEPAKQKKRFSFKKPFKLSGFSFKKSAKKEPENQEPAEEEGEKKEEEKEEAKPEADGAEGAEGGAQIEEEKPAEEQKTSPSEEEVEKKPEESTKEEEKPTETSDAQPVAQE